MNKERFDKFVAEMAKDIVVANLSENGVVASEMTGSDVSDFYSEIFKGIRETLKDTDIVDN